MLHKVITGIIISLHMRHYIGWIPVSAQAPMQWDIERQGGVGNVKLTIL